MFLIKLFLISNREYVVLKFYIVPYNSEAGIVLSLFLIFGDFEPR